SADRRGHTASTVTAGHARHRVARGLGRGCRGRLSNGAVLSHGGSATGTAGRSHLQGSASLGDHAVLLASGTAAENFRHPRYIPPGGILQGFSGGWERAVVTAALRLIAQ